MTKNSLRYILSGVLSIFILYNIYIVFVSHSVLGFSQKIPKEYLEIFPFKAREKLSLEFTYTVEGKNPVTSAVFDNLYDIVFCKLDFANFQELSLNELITKQTQHSIQTHLERGTIINSNLFDMTYNIDKHIGNEEIAIYSGDDFILDTYVSDSIVTYSVTSNNFSLSYDDSHEEFLLKTKRKQFFGSNKIPMSILFIKKNDGIYFVLMSANSIDDELPNDLLLDIFRPVR